MLPGVDQMNEPNPQHQDNGPQTVTDSQVVNLFQLPQATPGVVTPLPPAGDQPAPSGGSEVDQHGNAFDPRIHEHRVRPNGHWAKKRGNGARAAAGLSLAGATSGRKPGPPPTEKPPAPTSPTVTTAPPPPAAASPGPFLALDVLQAAPGGSGPVNARNQPEQPAQAGAPIVPEVMRTAQDYQTTAESLTAAQFGVMSMALGKAWEAEPQEAKAWTEAWKRTMAHYQTPILGPILELVVLAIGTVSRRWHDPTTAARAGGFWRWIRRQPPQSAPPASNQPNKVA